MNFLSDDSAVAVAGSAGFAEKALLIVGLIMVHAAVVLESKGIAGGTGALAVIFNLFASVAGGTVFAEKALLVLSLVMSHIAVVEKATGFASRTWDVWSFVLHQS